MGIMVSLEKLRRTPLFAGIAREVLKEVAMASEEIEIGGGERLICEGEPADALYVILSGAVELKVALDPEGAYHAGLDTLRRGEVIGWSALVEPRTYTMGAFAVKTSRLAKLDGARLCQVMESNPEVGYLLMRRLAAIIASRLAAVHIRFASLVEGGQWQRLDRRPSPRQNPKERSASLN